MPFELGLAYSLVLSGKDHDVVVLESKKYRLDKSLSDYKGRDPLIHWNKSDELISCLLDLINVPEKPPPSELRSAARLLRSRAQEIKREYRADTIFRAATYQALVEAATLHAVDRGFIST